MGESNFWEISEASTNPGFGCIPSERSLDELLSAGGILVDKPRGPSSHQLAAWARETLGITRLGHGGTLDPFATGLLTILCGKATRLTEIVLKGDKRYVGVLRFGRDVSDDEFESTLSLLNGVIYNVPPLESAVKIQVRTRTIHSLKMLESDTDSRIAAFEVSCSAGTYIRTLAKDIGLMLDTKCDLTELHRDRTGPFDQTMACSMQQLADAVFLHREHGDESALVKLIAPVEVLLSSLPSITV